jgi:penicillin-binding protein 2
MAGIANGSIVPKLQLIRQVQDTRGRVVQATQPQRKQWLGVDSKAVKVVHKGMSDVVNSGGGTGHAGALSYTTLCAKTGTAQWGPKSKNQRLAWFAGFLPADNPRYAFAVLYEGRPGETVSGGRMAAPMVRKFFEGIKDDIKDTIAPPKKALIVVDESAPKTQGDNSPISKDPDNERILEGQPVEGPLKALPVGPVDTDGEGNPDDSTGGEPINQTPEKPRPIRAIPVKDDEVIQEGIEEP